MNLGKFKEYVKDMDNESEFCISVDGSLIQPTVIWSGHGVSTENKIVPTLLLMTKEANQVFEDRELEERKKAWSKDEYRKKLNKYSVL